MFLLKLFGNPRLERTSGPVAGRSTQRRRLALLAVLALEKDRPISRDKLLAYFWGEIDTDHARALLSDSIYVLRKELGETAIISAGDDVQLNPEVVRCDVGEFANALVSGQLDLAVELYAGPLLDGFHIDDAPEFERRIEIERDRLGRAYARALEDLAVACEANNRSLDAVEWWQRLAIHDPASGRIACRLLQALDAAGDRAAALRFARAHVSRVREEFEIEPDPDVLDYMHDLQRTGGYRRAPKEIASLPEAIPTTDVVETGVSSTDPRIPPSARGHQPWRAWLIGGGLLVAGAAAVAATTHRSVALSSGRPRTAVAVLPFRNLSSDSSYGFFAAGLHDELLTQLAKVSSLRVVGRTSVRGYEGTTKPLRQIGEELAVGSIVEASVQVVGNRLRVTVHLLDPVSQGELWADRYDRTLGDAFAVESDITQRIVAAVGAKLTGYEAGAIAAVPTRNAEAYELYLQGLDYQRRPGVRRENLQIAQQLYERALALDSDFALAHAAVSYVHMSMYELHYDRSPPRPELAQREADVALRLAPDLPQAHLAAGVLSHARGAYREALDQFNHGLQGAPNDPDLWTWIGIVQRNLGSWESAVAALDHARTIDPRDVNLFQVLGDTHHFLRHYGEAIDAYRHALVFAPDLIETRLSVGWSYFLWTGELDTLRTVLRTLPRNGDPGGGARSIADQRLWPLLWERHPDSLLSLLHVMDAAVGTTPDASLFRVLWTARALNLRRDTAAARLYCDSALAILDVEERAHPDDRSVHGMRGQISAALGRRAEALREADWLQRFDDYPEDRYSSGTGDMRARIFARVGETGKALTEVEQLLARPSLFSIYELRLSPDFDSIRNNPRYHALLQKYTTPRT